MQEIDFSRFELSSEEQPSKVVPLKKAIIDHVRPGMHLHFWVGHANPNAAICEIARQYWGTKPNFTVYSMLLYQHGISLVFGGLVKKLVCTFAGDSYPSGSPNRVIQEAHGQKELEIECWSILTYIKRFMAGAMGIPFLPTRSLSESGMPELNKGSFIQIDNPFDDGNQIGLVSAASPDLSFVHAHAADSSGNLIGTGPGAEAQWGAMASKGGIIATTEKLVSTEFVKQHSSLVRIPGYMVKAVAVTPYGSHPRGITNQGNPELATYFDDFEYLLELRKAYKNRETAAQWVDRWILSCEGHDDYLKKLGSQRLHYLTGRAGQDAWRREMLSISHQRVFEETYNATEMMVVQASREIRDIVVRNGFKVLLAGVGVSNLAAWMADQVLRQEKYPMDLVAEFGFFDYLPPPGDPSLHKIDNLLTTTMMTDAMQILGVHATGANNRCVGVLGTAQIDKCGNLNSTMIPDKTYLVGSGGANDVASGSRQVVVVAAQKKNSLVKSVPFITCPGKRVKTLVTDVGVFEKMGDDDEFTLTKVLPTSDGHTLEQQVQEAKQRCGWHLSVSDEVVMCNPPEADSLSTLRLFDPNGYFTGR